MDGVGEVVCSEIVTVVGRKISIPSYIIDQILFAVLMGTYYYISHSAARNWRIRCLGGIAQMVLLREKRKVIDLTTCHGSL